MCVLSMELEIKSTEKNEEGFLSALLTSSIFGVFLYQEEGKIILSNKTFRDFIGYSADELKDMTPYDILADEYKAEVKNLVERRMRGEVFVAEQIKHIHKTKDGLLKNTVVFAYTINYLNRPTGLVLVMDATKEAKQQEKIESVSLLYATLSEINQIIVRAKNETFLLSDICNKIVEKGLFKDAWMGFFDENKILRYTFSYSKSNYVDYIKTVLNGPQAEYGPSITAFLKSKIVINNNTQINPLVATWRNELLRRGYLSSASVPIIKKGKTVGSLNIYSGKTGIFNKETYRLLAEIKIDINYALDKIEDEKWLAMTSSALNSGFDFMIIMDKYFSFIYINENTYKIFGYSDDELKGKHFSTLFFGGTGKNGFAKKFKDTILSDKVLTDIFIYRTKDKRTVYGHTSITPFKVGKSTEYYIAVGKDITRELVAEETMDKLIHFDILTGLPNRKFLKEKMESFLKELNDNSDKISALAVINPINFSLINQTEGFEAGNRIMAEIAKRIKERIKDYDVPAKLEADKFSVFLKDLRYEEDALVVAGNILKYLSEGYMIDNKRINLSFNAGIAFYPKDSKEPQDILNKAEAALSNAKINGENSIGFFKKEFEEYARQKVDLRNSLRDAIEKKEFILHYQPYFDANTGLIKGAEALLRWKRNNKIIPPMDFIVFLEQNGMIAEVENWIIDEVVSKIKLWINKGLNVVPVSVNISPVNFKGKYLKENIIKTLRKHDVEPKFLTVEIVERTFIEDFEYSNALLNDLKESGIQLSIDDFGTGYSSLSYLADLPFDNLKIDISFIRRMLIDKHSRYIVETILYLSKKLNMKSIAEGVETEDQLKFLRDSGCDYIQGFLLSKPLEDDAFEKFLQ